MDYPLLCDFLASICVAVAIFFLFMVIIITVFAFGMPGVWDLVARVSVLGTTFGALAFAIGWTGRYLDG